MKIANFCPRVFFCALAFAFYTLSGTFASSQMLTTLKSFSPTYFETYLLDYEIFTNTDGANPAGQLLLNGNTLYGTTSDGGNYGAGNVFKVNLDGTGFTVLKTFFCIQTITFSDGAYPDSGMVLISNTLYGTTISGGTNGFGTVFKINTDGTGYLVLTSFSLNTNASEGSSLYGGVVTDGTTLYGTDYSGGTSNFGALYKLATDGSGLTNIRCFTNGDGAKPYSSLTLSGNTLYGMTQAGGANNSGTIFKIDTNGSNFVLLRSFSSETNSTNTDGGNPRGGLCLSGGTLYGTGSYGGKYGSGTIFKINTDGTGFSVLKTFSAWNFNSGTNLDGANPFGSLVLNGSTLYGTTLNGGTNGGGTAFKIHTNGTGFETLQHFAGYNGASPWAGMVFNDGTLYGTTYGSGYGPGNYPGATEYSGTVFSINNLNPVPTLSFITTSNSIKLLWSTVPGIYYQVQYCTNLSSQNWYNLTGLLTASGNSLQTSDNIKTNLQRFYRVALVP